MISGAKIVYSQVHLQTFGRKKHPTKTKFNTLNVNYFYYNSIYHLQGFTPVEIYNIYRPKRRFTDFKSEKSHSVPKLQLQLWGGVLLQPIYSPNHTTLSFFPPA